MLLLVNLHAERRMCPVNDASLAAPDMKEAAILLLQGSVSIMNAEGKEIEVLNPGQCFNEQILLGYPNSKNEYVMPKVLSEVQIVNQLAWEKVTREFEDEAPVVKQNILKHMAERSESRLGVKPGSTTMLKSSALFRGTSDAFVEALHRKLEFKLYEPGQAIVEAGRDGDCFYLLLDGIAEAILKDVASALSPGAFFGEAVLIGMVQAFQKTVRAKSLCIVQRLRKVDFETVLAQHPENQRYFEQAVSEAEKDRNESLPIRVRQTMSFETCNPDFLRYIMPTVDDAFFMPDEKILLSGEEFVVGISEIYCLLAGQAVVENNLGVTLGVVNVGEVLGEAALVGLSSGRRTASVRAWSKSLVHCARIQSRVMAEAFQKHPDQKAIFVKLGEQRYKRNQDLIERRTLWLNEVALPAMQKSYLFQGCDAEQLRPIAATLAETTYAPGEVITRAGEQTNTMIMLLEGDAALESKCGMNVGSFSDGAIIGEVAVMGIFSMRTATVRANQRCRVIHLAQEVLMRTLQRLDDLVLRDKIEDLAASRQKQIKRGLPLSALPLGIPIDDLCVRAVALQAHRIDLQPEETLQAIDDAGPCGPYFSVLVRGRLIVEMASDTSDVTTLTPGSLILEGMVADYSAHLRAKCHCELYRVRQSDFMIAVVSVPTAGEWFYRFRLLERETRERFLMRLKSAKGALQSLIGRPWRPLSSSSSTRGPLALEDGSNVGKLQRPGTAPLMLRREAGEEERPQRAGSLPVSVKPLDASDTTCGSNDRTRSCIGRRRLRSAVKADRSFNELRSSKQAAPPHRTMQRCLSATMTRSSLESRRSSKERRRSSNEEPPPVLISSQFAADPNAANLWTVAAHA